MEPNQQPSYDFITNPGQNRKPGFGMGGKKQQMAIFAIFSLVVLFVAIWVGSLLFSGGGGANEGLVSLQAHQTEIDRVITLGQANIADPQLKQRFSTLQATITSDKKQLSGLLSNSGVEVTALQLSAQKDKKTDTALENAIKLGNHDEELQEIINTLADRYYSAMSNAKKTSLTKNGSNLLATAISNIETIFTSN